MRSRPRRENEYDRLNRATCTMQELSSEYQLLRADSTTAIRHQFMARNLGTQKLKEEEFNSMKVALKKILITMVVANIMLVLLITVIAIVMAVFVYTRPTTGEIINDMNSLKTNTNQLAATFQTLQTNLSQVLFQLDALNSDILSVQQQSSSQQIQLYCGAGDWQRIAFINMSDPSQQCPTDWREFNTSEVRACGRQNATVGTCSAVFYPAATQYCRVCGRVIGYQRGSPDAFSDGTIDQAYIDGASITHGTSPREHIWSYAAGVTENSLRHTLANCPCSTVTTNTQPSFVESNYYCESGNPTDSFEYTQIFFNDPLWDGKQCEDACCSDTNYPPWFSVELPAPTTDMIEVRICGNEPTSNENTLIEQLEIFVEYNKIRN